MTVEELNKKVEGLRMITDAKMKYLRDHSKLLDQAFEEVTEDELDIIHEKIEELNKRMDVNGLSNNE